MITPNEQFIERFKSTPGAISVCESIAIMNICSQVPKDEGIYIELGSNAGKSGQSAAYGLPEGTFYMVDPIFDLTNLEAWKHSQQGHPDNLAWGYAAEPDFCDKVRERVELASKGKVKPILLGTYSYEAIEKFDKISYCFVDSDNHSDERIKKEIELLLPRMVKGGIISFHDFCNQYIAPREAHERLIASGEYENIEINWSEILDYVRTNNLEDGNNSWHERGSEEFPKFVGAVRKK